MLLRAVKRNAALSMILHLLLLAILWFLSVRLQRWNSSDTLTFNAVSVVFFQYVLWIFLAVGILMLLFRNGRKKQLRFPFLYQFAGIGNLVYATFGLVLLMMGAGAGTILGSFFPSPRVS